MSDENVPKYTYVVASADKETHWVMVVHDDSVDWYRRVATFTSRKRADDYADLENTFSADAMGDEFWRKDRHAEDDTPVPAALADRDPKSSLIPGEIVRRLAVSDEIPSKTVENRRNLTDLDEGRHPNEVVAVFVPNAPRPSEPVAPTVSKLETVQAPEPVSEPCQPAPADGKQVTVPDDVNTGPASAAQDDAVAAEDGEHPHDEGHIREGVGAEDSAASDPAGDPPPVLKDAATLDLLTEKQAKVFRTFAGRASLSAAELISLSAYANVQDALSSLEKKGYVERLDGYPLKWAPLAAGEPRIDTQWQAKRWSETELSGLKELCEAGGDMEAYAASIDRTLQAVEQQARTWRWYDEWARKRRSHQAPVPVATAPPPIVNEEEPIGTDDLSTRQQFVLKMIVDGRDMGKQNIFDAAALKREGIEPLRDQPFIIKRLSDLGCIQLGDGGWHPTALGREIAAKIPEALSPKPETKVSYPVVRRTEAPAVPPKANGHAAEVPHHPDADKLDVAKYLEKKGHTITRVATGLFIVDGERRRLADIMPLINQHRLATDPDLPPLDAGAVR